MDFKVGDKVTCSWGTGTIVELLTGVKANDTARVVFDYDEYRTLDLMLWSLKLLPSSPIQTRTAKELVPGVYGRVYVDREENSKIFLGLDRSYKDSFSLKHGTIVEEFTAQELRAAADVFKTLADWLEEKE